MEEDYYGIQKEYAHPRAIELIPEVFFWDCVDELSPFGSDEGDLALAEYREWKKVNLDLPSYLFLKLIIEGIGKMSISDYNEQLLDEELIKNQIESNTFDDHYYIYTLDISVIATGFGQLVDDGKIDTKNKPSIQLAIDRQRIWAKLLDDWEYCDDYIGNLNILDRVLEQA